MAIYSSHDLIATDPAFESAVKDVVAGLPADAVDKVVTYYDTDSPQTGQRRRPRHQGHLTLAGASQDAKSDSYEEVKDALDADGLTTTSPARGRSSATSTSR